MTQTRANSVRQKRTIKAAIEKEYAAHRDFERRIFTRMVPTGDTWRWAGTFKNVRTAIGIDADGHAFKQPVLSYEVEARVSCWYYVRAGQYCIRVSFWGTDDYMIDADDIFYKNKEDAIKNYSRLVEWVCNLAIASHDQLQRLGFEYH